MNSRTRRKRRAALIQDKDLVRCCFCEQIFHATVMTIEHIQPRSLGGSDHISNLALSCDPCNNERGCEDFETFKRKKWFCSVGSHAY